tara:strand:- start:21 stop:221 length:201 start_codon:yes stop_codon:yes gene_type:complete
MSLTLKSLNTLPILVSFAVFLLAELMQHTILIWSSIFVFSLGVLCEILFQVAKYQVNKTVYSDDEV